MSTSVESLIERIDGRIDALVDELELLLAVREALTGPRPDPTPTKRRRRRTTPQKRVPKVVLPPVERAAAAEWRAPLLCEDIIAALSIGPASCGDIAAMLATSTARVRARLLELRREGEVKSAGGGAWRLAGPAPNWTGLRLAEVAA